MMNIMSREHPFSIRYVFIIAVLLRLSFALVLNPDRYYFSDTRHYDRAAMSLLQSGELGEKYYRAPLYPVVLAAVYAVFGHSFLAMRLVEALISVLLCWLVYKMADTLFGARIAWWATLLSAVFPHFILLAGILYPTNLFTLFLFSALFFLWYGRHSGQKKMVMLSAVLAGLAGLTVASMFFILPFWLLWLLWEKRAQGLHDVALYAIVLALVLAPWTVRNYAKYGRLTLVQPLPHTVLPNLQDHTAQEQEVAGGFQTTVTYFKEHPTGTDQDGLGKTLLHYLQHPWGALGHLLTELGHFWALYPDRLDTARDAYRASIHERDQRMETGGSIWRYIKWPSILVMAPLFACAIVGVPIAWRRHRSAALLLLLTIFSFAVGYSMIYSEVRYRIPVEPVLLIFAAIGLDRLMARRGRAT
jgi:4-amino-4-deoxy-L-arabinose transferase-like glycosyltransferase